MLKATQQYILKRAKFLGSGRVRVAELHKVIMSLRGALVVLILCIDEP